MDSKCILKELEKFGMAHNFYDVIDDWFAVMALSLIQAVTVKDDAWKKREQKYLDIVAKYSRDEIQIFVKCFDMLVTLMEQDVNAGVFKDWLGEIYMESETFSKKKLGQCFTPYSVGKALAMLALSNEGISKDRAKPISLNDCCVGSGCLVIAYCEALHNLGINYQKMLYVEVNDVDTRCFHMAYVQLSLLGVSGKIQMKNTLSQEQWDEWKTAFLALQDLKIKKFYFLNTKNRKEMQ